MSSRAPLKRQHGSLAAAAPLEPGPQTGQRDFVRLVSHELRTPLNAIIGFSEILTQEAFGPLGSPEYKDYAEIILASGLRMLRLVNQVMEIAKLQSGADELVLGGEALDEVFEDVAKSTAAELSLRGLTLKRAVPDPAPVALADARAIRTAIVNLLQNAAAFAPEGGEIRLTGRLCGPLVQIEVADDGEGLDPVDLARLMRPFEQGEHALVRRTGGAGLGWAVVRAMTEAMGGRFEVHTAPGEGLAATLSFRRAG